MPLWQLGASAKEFDRLQEYARQFGLLEIDLEKAEKLGFGPIQNIAQLVIPNKEWVYSIHLRYDPKKDGSADGIDTSISDLEWLCTTDLGRQLRANMFVTHTDYPQNVQDLLTQLRRLGEAAKHFNVVIAVENLADRKNKTNGYMAPRNPREMAEALEKIAGEDPELPNYLGLCLDTGHAISNAGLTDSLDWNDDLVKRWVRHVHYNDNTIRGDEHMPICQSTNAHLIAALNYLLENSAHKGAVIFEHRKLSEGIQSIGYVQTPEYIAIKPAPLG